MEIPDRTKPYKHEEYPKVVPDGEGGTKIVNSREEELASKQSFEPKADTAKKASWGTAKTAK